MTRREVAAMTHRHWQVFAALAARDAEENMQVLDAVPGSAVTQFEDGSAEAAMIVDADSDGEARLFVRLVLLELGLTVTGLSITEVDDEQVPPQALTDPAMVRAEQWARDLVTTVPALT